MLNPLTRHPAAYARFAATGKLPPSYAPESPLIALLRAIGPRWCGQIRGLRVGPDLGYSGSRQFQTAAQALRWMAPDDEVIGSHPAESWRLKGFRDPLFLEDLAAHCSSFPERLYQEFPRLHRKQGAPKQTTPNAGEDEGQATGRQ